MARRVFFCFHYDLDHWRAKQILESNVVTRADRAGCFDPLEYEDAKGKGVEAVKRMIVRHLANSTVTVVLIGSRTSVRPLVKYGIEESVKRGNGLLGIRIHHLKDQMGRISTAGRLPPVPNGVEFPVYDWDGDAARFAGEIEAAGQRAQTLRMSRR